MTQPVTLPPSPGSLQDRIIGSARVGDQSKLPVGNLPYVQFSQSSLVPLGRPATFFDSLIGDSLVAAVQSHFADIKPPCVVYWRAGPWFDQVNTTEGTMRRVHCRCLIVSDK